MKPTKAATAKTKRTAAQALDPRFAALARLLARHATRQDFERGLSAAQAEGYDSDSSGKDES
jgi:hypothetical protein